jgi:hypothetical protein
MMKKILAALPLHRILLFGLLLFSHQLLSQNEIDFPVAAQPVAPATLLFDYPSQVDANDIFVLTCTIRKNKPTASSTLTFTSVPGFTLQADAIAGAETVSIGNKTTLSWKAIIESPQNSFSIKIAVRDLQQGVYPLIAEYSDSHGYRSKQALSVYVNNPSPPQEYVADPFAGKNPYTLTVLHPETVKPKENFEIKMQIAKGKNTGTASLILKVPSASSITLDGYPEAFYENGQLLADIPMMPSSPTFEITAQVANDALQKAVYPLQASVTYSDGHIASWKGFLYSDVNSIETSNAQRTPQDNDYDTTTVFSRIDSLLNAWTASVPAVKTKPKEPRKQQAVVAESSAEPTTTVSKSESKAFKTDIPNNKFYSIQIAASKVPQQTMKSFLQSMGVQHTLHEEYDGTYYRYFVGEFDTIDHARRAVAKISGMGFPEAFVVLFENGRRSKRVN